LAQRVRDTRIVQLDRRRSIVRDEKGVVAEFGVSPVSIPDYLALVGDAADGYPGLPGWERSPPQLYFLGSDVSKPFRRTCANGT